MQLGKKLMACAAFLATVTFAAPAMAVTVGDDVTANTNVNVRSAPMGTILDVMLTGETGVVVGRSGNWCDTVRPAGADGWVYCTYLTPTGTRPAPMPEPVEPPRAEIEFGFSVPGFSFFIGPGAGFRFDPRGPRFAGQVCFYERTHYRGASICARPGDQRGFLGAWNNRISSIRVTGGAEAVVCERPNFRGRCTVIDSNVRTLGPTGNNVISSFWVR